MDMLVTFEVIEREGELVAVHDGGLGLLIALGRDWDMLRDTVNETVASAIGEVTVDVEIELFIDANHRTRFKHVYDRAVAERIRKRSDNPDAGT
ncbi:MAG TPA: hypothetical protein VMC84_00320 [Methanocella sp.]|uniref:hypothetical protein n=1 Tax=Methanocella sp. TaxID=2052833 RepID=UPI002BCF06B7|nr:hypothetical protein [Methanocella sp.]HTY89600.1 hypothetical protein [Methanocella sp.]